MPLWSSRYLEEPVFLKASECIDIHATGALTQFAVLKMEADKRPAKQEAVSNMQIFEIDDANPANSKFVPMSNALYKELYDHVKKGGEGEAQGMEPYIMTAAHYNEFARQAIKSHPDGHFVILSTVCCPCNIEKLTADIRGDKRAQRAVKLMKRQSEAGGLTYTSFMRVKCTGSSIESEISLLQVEDGKGDFILVTSSDALLAEGGQMYKIRHGKFDSAEAQFHSHASIKEIAQSVDFDEGQAPDESQLPVTTSPVVVLQKNRNPVELMTRLSAETREKVCDSKDCNPTQIHSASSLTQMQGSAFKHAATVSLGFMDCPGRVLSYKVKTVLLESKH